MAGEHLYTNRLISEKSPYLLQHAHNPVDWHPWGEEAFARAVKEDKPIFLSIGYAACHWCHVMEKESFENLEIANLLNNFFINIKVDREELPDVDRLYMEFAQAIMANSAGWPLNLFLTPQLHPFFAFSYLPPQEEAAMPGMIDLIAHIHELWGSEQRERILEQSRQIVQFFQKNIQVQGRDIPDQGYVSSAVDLLLQLFDTTYGGIKGAPKFPVGYQYSFLMHYAYLEKDSRSLFAVGKTLDMMHRGGIYDHLGGGFSRYSTDEHWQIPHFEKMLYDNALLAECYCEAWKGTGRPLYRRVCCEIIDYVLLKLTGEKGGFYSSEDADSEGEEGKFYLWSIDEIENILDEKDADLFCSVYGVTSLGNFEGRNILHLPDSFEEYAEHHQLDFLQFQNQIDKLRGKLFAAREQRVHPLKDDKVLSSWNGLMIHAIVEAGKALDIPAYVRAGLKAAQFIEEKLWKEGGLYRRYREGKADFHAGLDEYAFMIRAALTLFEAGCGSRWLGWALKMEKILRDQFKSEGGAFYQTDGSDPSLILRQCAFADGAEPSGNAVHCENLLRLALMTDGPIYRQQAEDILKAVKKYFDKYAPSFTFHFRNLLRYYQRQAPTIIIALNDRLEGRKELERIIFENYIPHRAVIWRCPDDQQLFELIPGVKGQPPTDGRTTVYICHGRVCEKPLVEYQEIQAAIENLAKVQ